MECNEYRVVGPPGCVSGDAIVEINRCRKSFKTTLEKLYDGFNGKSVKYGWDLSWPTKIRSRDCTGSIVLRTVSNVVFSGAKPCLLLRLIDGRSVSLTEDHLVLSDDGWCEAGSLRKGQFIHADAGVSSGADFKKPDYKYVEGLRFHPLATKRNSRRYAVLESRLAVEAYRNGTTLSRWIDSHRSGSGIPDSPEYLSSTHVVHHIDRDHKNNVISNLEVVESQSNHSRLHGLEGGWRRVTAKSGIFRVLSIDSAGIVDTYDVSVVSDGGEGNFLANGIVVHNCGKTTYLSGQVKARVNAWCEATGLQPDQCQSVLVSSLTRTAAAEVRGRDTMIGDEQVGTLHSHAFRALGSPKMCVDSKSLKEWNSRARPEYRIKGDDDELASRGDAILSEYNLARCRLTPRDEWPASLLEFASEYESWKRETGSMDYEDLIENAYRDNTTAPNCPSTILVDEAQDCTASEFRLVRRWARHAKKLIMVGDTDQAIFYFRGADPDSFYAAEIPEENMKVLSQSYRVPKAVHSEALRMIRRVKRRLDVKYEPTEVDGECSWAGYGMRYGLNQLMEQIEQRLSGGLSVMCLYACAYMAQPLCSALRGAGIPYWNRYAAERPQFNPLHPPKGVGLLQRVQEYLRPNEHVYGDKARMWTWSELQHWTDVCNANGLLVRGKKSRIDVCASEWPDTLVTADDIVDLFDPEEIDKLSNCDLDYFESKANNAKVGLIGYIREIINRGGFPAILEPPKLTVGTIHSCKGGEADSVFLCPDLSASGWECIGDVRFRDSIYRTMYVGMTRAKRELILTSPSNRMRVEW